MILSKTVRQIVSYRTVGDELDNDLRLIQKQGGKVMDVTETEVNPIPGLSTQGFIILYENGTSLPKSTEEPILDKIRAEIDELDVLKYSSGERIYKDEVLDIIDKYKVESEES